MHAFEKSEALCSTPAWRPLYTTVVAGKINILNNINENFFQAVSAAVKIDQIDGLINATVFKLIGLN